MTFTQIFGSEGGSGVSLKVNEEEKEIIVEKHVTKKEPAAPKTY